MSSQLSYAFHSSIRTDCNFTPKTYKLNEENQAGTLQLGRRRHTLRVTEMSAFEFIAVIANKPVANLKLGSQATLRVLEGEWRVTIKGKSMLPDGQVRLEMEQVEDTSEPEVPRNGFFTGSRSVALSARDPILPLAIAVAVIITVLILPSLGGKWGTSQPISDSVQSGWKSVTSGFKR
jgi:hypothetical protein